MVAMGIVLLMPAIRIWNRVPQVLLGIFADDRNAVTTSVGDMNVVEAAWKAVERATALLDNADKCVRWSCWWAHGAYQIQGEVAKALGVELQKPRMGASAREVTTVAKGCSMARRASLLPTPWEVRRT
eukprot:8647631-Alexandrium_andersonii.AAC.1